MCLAADTVDAGDEEFVRAPPSGDPAWSRHARGGGGEDPLRLLIETWVEGVRAEAGMPALSAAMYRRRRAADHLDVALEFAQRRRAAVGLQDDELCRSVLAAMDAEVIGSCAYCGCNFTVVAVVDMAELGAVCGVCGRRLLVHDPVAPVRDLPENADERWKGWLPW